MNGEIKVLGEIKIQIIYFVHGTTYDNTAGKCSGWKQVELNELGEQQAIEDDWRKQKAWQPGWKYIIN